MFSNHQTLKGENLTCRSPQKMGMVKDANGFWGQSEIKGGRGRKKTL